MTDAPITALLAVDVEPDDPEFTIGSRKRWSGFEACVRMVGPLRDRLAGATGRPVRFTWFLRMDPQVDEGYGSATWVAETYPAELDALRNAGDELAVHPHAWRWDLATGRWLADVGNPEWVEHCTRSSFEAYERAFGRPCRAHRAGDRFMTDSIVRVMRDLRVAVDLTPEPGMRGVGTGRSRPHTAALPDMACVPRIPYVPSTADWRTPAESGGIADDLLMIPLTSADPGPALNTWRRVGRRVKNLGRTLNRPLYPWADVPGEQLWDIIERDIRTGALSTITFAMRSHLPLDDTARTVLLANMRRLENHALSRSLVFETASAARDRIMGPATG